MPSPITRCARVDRQLGVAGYDKQGNCSVADRYLTRYGRAAVRCSSYLTWHQPTNVSRNTITWMYLCDQLRDSGKCRDVLEIMLSRTSTIRLEGPVKILHKYAEIWIIIIFSACYSQLLLKSLLWNPVYAWTLIRDLASLVIITMKRLLSAIATLWQRNQTNMRKYEHLVKNRN